MNPDSKVNKTLIRVVSEYPCLYDCTSRSTCNRGIRDQAWKEVMKKLARENTSIIDPVLCWKALRSNFTRHHRLNNKNWLYYYEMQFLERHTKHKGNSKLPVKYVNTWPCGVPNANIPSTSGTHLGVVSNCDQPSNSRAQWINSNLEQVFIPSNSVDQHIYNTDDYTEQLLVPAIEEAAISSNLLSDDTVQSMYNEEHCYSKEYDDSPVVEQIFEDIPTNVENFFESAESNVIEDVVFEQDEATNGNEANSSVLNENSNVTPLDEDIVPLRCSREKIFDQRDVDFNIITSQKSNRSTDDENSVNRKNEESAFSCSNVKKRNQVKQKHREMSEPIIVNKIQPKKVTPKLDDFAKKKIKNKKKADVEAENAIVKCCTDMSSLNKSAKNLIRLQKLELQQRLSTKPAEQNILLPVQQMQSNDGFLNLMRNNWMKLTEEEQDQLFFEVLAVMEDFERNA